MCEINDTNMLYTNQIIYHVGNLPAPAAPAGIVEQSAGSTTSTQEPML